MEISSKMTGDKFSVKLPVPQIPAQYNAMPAKGYKEKVQIITALSSDSENNRLIGLIPKSHVQGYTQYAKNGVVYYIFTLNVKEGETQGYIIVAPYHSGSFQKATCFGVPNGWLHPGGIQTIGDYLFVPCEEGGSSIVVVYSLEKIAQHKLYLMKKFEYKNHRAGSVGVTDFYLDDVPHYLMVIGDSGTFYGYISKVPDDTNDWIFSDIGSFTVADGKVNLDCQGFALYTETDNTICMIPLVSRGSGISYEDWAYMYKLQLEKNDKGGYVVKAIPNGEMGDDPAPHGKDETEWKRHFKSSGGGYSGVHFRFGAGAWINGDRFVILASERNIHSDCHIDINYWVKE